jgi:hypothetical protein
VIPFNLWFTMRAPLQWLALLYWAVYGLEDGTLAPCNLGLVLSSRQLVSKTKLVAPLWASLEYPCHYHLSLAIPNVSLHAEELDVYQRIATQRPRTYLIVMDDWQDYQVERNLAIKVR